MVVLSLCIAAGLVLLALAVYERTTGVYKAVVQMKGPGIRVPFIGNSYIVWLYTAKTAFASLRNLANRFKSGYYLYYMNTLVVQVQTAELFETVLTSSKITKGFFYTFLEPYVGTGVLTSKGAKWIERRAIISPCFHVRMLNQFFPTFKAHTDTMVESISSRQNVGIKVNSMFSKYSLSLICETSMGIPLDDSANYEKSLTDFGNFVQARVFAPLLFDDRMYRWLGYARKCNRLIKPMHEFARDVIKRRRAILDSRGWPQQNTTNNDDSVFLRKNQFSLLDALLTAQHDKGVINDAGIEEEVNTFVFAGHDTVTAAMTYTMLCIGEHPEVQQKLYEEIKAVVNGDELTVSHLASCTYMDIVVKEALRLLPPVPVIFRSSTDENIEFDGVNLTPGVNFYLSIFELHRNPKYYPDPDKFIPERFLPENLAQRHHFAYMPFGAGPRMCMGQKYAIMQMKTMIAKMIQQYRLESVSKIKELEFVTDMILHTRHPVEIKFVRRS